MKTNPLPKIRAALLAALALGAACAHGAATFIPGDQPFGDVPALSLTGFNLSTGTQKAFQVIFSNESFAGDVAAYPIGTDGRTQLQNRIWSATDVFTAHQGCGTASDPASATTNYWDVDRNVVTRNGTTNIPFRWASGGLSNAQKTSIDADITAGGLGDKIHRFIRGDRANEKVQSVTDEAGTVLYTCGTASGIFRGRVSILGDVLHTRPLYIGAPPADFTFDGYQTFKSDNSGRSPRLYVGANDGMVHSFDANSGVEQFAYIPSMLIPNLSDLKVFPYAHTYFVDGQMTAGDVNFGTTGTPDWRTVIVGGLGAGGKGLFALDVTSADASDETEAKAKILWEITPASSGFADLGYTYGTPVIVRLNTGQWAVIVNNGYLNTNTGHAVLYIIDIKDGTLIKALDTGSGSVGTPNGLSPATAIDSTFDGKVDRIYAGDIDGNLWKFNVSATTAASWPAPTKIFPTATDITNGITAKAIIGAPDVAAHPTSGYMVYFATGRMFTTTDASDATVQNYAYGLWDGAPIANTTFLAQTLTEKTYDTQRVRVSSGLPVNFNDPGTVPLPKVLHKGWRTALPAGERVIGTGFVRDARYQFTSVNPTITHGTPPTPPSGENWLIELDYLTGGALDKPIFDLSRDSLLTDTDRVMNSGGTARQAGTTGIPVAIYMGAGLVSQPVLANVNAQLSTTLFNDNPHTSPNEVPLVPPVATERGVLGGHFDVEIYYKNSGGYICDYDNLAAKAHVQLRFTNNNSRKAKNMTIKLGGVDVLLNNIVGTGNNSSSSLRQIVANTSNQTTAFKALWSTSSSSGSTVTFIAKNNGVALNGKALVVTLGSTTNDTLLSSELSYPDTGTTNSTGGVDDARGPMQSGNTTCDKQDHRHEYDDAFNVTGVDFLNASEALYNLSNAIPSTSTQFKILVANQYLSPAVTLSLGGAPHISIKEFTTGSTLTLSSLPTYTRANIGTFEFNMPLDAFTIKDWWTGSPPEECTTNTAIKDCRAGLHPNIPACVYQADRDEGGVLFKPVVPPANGTNGPGTRNWVTSSPYTGSTGARNGGALTFMVIRANTPDSAIEQNVAGRPEYGWRLKEANFEDYILAMYTTFWHYGTYANDTPVAGVNAPNPIPAAWGKCYDATSWTKQPTPDNRAPSTGPFPTPAVGSSDPGASTVRRTVVGTPTTTTNTVGTVTTTATTTNFSDGSSMVVTTTTDSSTGNTTTTSEFFPGSGGQGGGNPTGDDPIFTRVESPETLTGYQQTRNSGKLGRVTWHELFRQ